MVICDFFLGHFWVRKPLRLQRYNIFSEHTRIFTKKIIIGNKKRKICIQVEREKGASALFFCKHLRIWKKSITFAVAKVCYLDEQILTILSGVERLDLWLALSRIYLLPPRRPVLQGMDPPMSALQASRTAGSQPSAEESHLQS